jgi:hypothetical protein
MWIETIILLIPLIVGIVQALKKYDAIDDLTENFNDRITEKSRNTGCGDTLAAKAARYTLIPLFSLFTSIHDLTENIRDLGLKSGIRIASYLYLVAFLFVIFITVGYKVLILALGIFVLLIAFALLRSFLPGRRSKASGDSSQDFVEKIWPYFRSDSTRERVAGFFDVPEIDVDYTGNVWTYENGASPGKKKIGRVDQLGQIYDTRHEAAVKIGWIDDRGRVIGDQIINPQ